MQPTAKHDGIVGGPLPDLSTPYRSLSGLALAERETNTRSRGMPQQGWLGLPGLAHFDFIAMVGSPGVAVHRDRRFCPLSREDAAVGCRLFAQAGRLAIVPVELRLDHILSRAPKPAVAEEGMRPTDEKKVCNVLDRIGQVIGVRPAALSQTLVRQRWSTMDLTLCWAPRVVFLSRLQ